MRGTRGITLIALIVTIIILLILAGITITELTGSGIFGKAKLAKQKTRYSAAKEIVNLKLIEIQVDCEEKGEVYNIDKIAKGMEKAEDITIEKYYNKETSKVKEGIDTEITVLKGIVVSVDEYSEYKFLIGEEGQITGVLQGKITNTTLKEEFVNIAEFENKTFGSKIPTDSGDKKSEEYYLYYKGNEYKEIAGEWVNNEKSPEYQAGKLTKEKEFMTYEAQMAYVQNPICTKELTMDISSYAFICAEVELIGENGGNGNRNVTLQILDKNGKVIKQKYNHGLGGNELAVGEIRTISLNFQDVEDLKDVYFGISANGYKFKIYSIYLKKLPILNVMVSDNSGIHNVDGKIINVKGDEIKKDIDGRDYIHFDGTTYILVDGLSELAGDTEKTLLCLVRANASCPSDTYVMNIGDDLNGGKKICIGITDGYLRFLTDWYTAIYNPRKDFVTDNNWHFVCVSYDKTKISLYFDNKMVFTENRTFETVNPQLVIGAWSTNGDYKFIGDISDVRVYNKGLNANEINTIYQEIKK